VEVGHEAVPACDTDWDAVESHAREVANEMANDLAFRDACGEGEQAEVLEVLVGEHDVEAAVEGWHVFRPF